ncbi:MAG: hypothetical protein GF419_00240 [Ignavibacteriales bacterium]|nr:hypothetical protein [Ignavibacteriales bacterium]
MNVSARKDFLKKMWRLENDERPAFVIGYLGPEVINGPPVKNAIFDKGDDSIKDRLRDPAKYLQAQLDEIESQKKLRGEYVPALCPSLGVIGPASAFGCEVIWWDEDFPNAKHLPGGVDAAASTPTPGVRDGELGRILDYTEYFIEQTGGEIPIRLTDIQGPLDSASLIAGHNDLMTAMMIDPESVRRLMKKVTELTIDFARAQRQICVDRGVEFVPAMFQPWMEDGFGITIANDDMVMISAEMHEEFHVPYVNMMSEEFGGIYMHSCGNWGHQFASLEKIRDLRGLEFGASEAPYKDIFERFGGKIVTACRVGFNRDVKFLGMKDYLEKILAAKTTNRGLFVNVDVTNGLTDETWGGTDVREVYRLMGVEA